MQSGRRTYFDMFSSMKRGGIMHRDRLVGILLVVFCIFGWLYLIPNYIKGESQQVFPQIILFFTFLPSMGLILRRSGPQIDDESSLVKQSQRKAFIKITFLAAMYLIYLLLIPVLGFFVCSLVIMVGTLLFLGIRKVKTLVFIPVVVLTLIHVIIERFLKFVLPAGLLL